MLHDALIQYLSNVESAIKSLDDVYIERYEEEILTSDRLNLRVRVRFTEGHLLELNEAVMVESGSIRNLGYRYHFQNEKSKLVFRYDNTPHFPDLKTYPHHKHLANDVIPSQRPSIPAVVLEAVNNIASI